MPATRFWIPTISRTIGLDTSGYETEHPIEHHLDNCLDTYSKASGTSNTITLDLDVLNILSGITWAGLWIHNYGESAYSLSPYREVRIESDTDSGFGAPTVHTTLNLNPVTYLPLVAVVVNGGAEVTDRYWRFVCGGLGIFQETSLAMLGTHVDIEAKYEYDGRDLEGSVLEYNRGVGLGNGSTIIQNLRSVGSKMFTRRYRYIDETDHDAIVLAHQLANGSFQPFIMQDANTNIKDAWFVRFMDDILPWSPIVHQAWNVELILAEEPYIRYGYRY
jgi:hypothetical protein